MEFSPELYWNIVKNVGNRNDITALCRVNKGFRHAAERALYNTLYLGTTEQIITVCDTLARQSRLASLVDALTLQVSDTDDMDSEDEDEDEEPEKVTDRFYLPDQHWESISHCLQKTHSLRHLNIHINNGPRASNAWILRNTAFRLRSFHCDLNWDQDLVDFLNTQADLDDLFISDFEDSKCSNGSSSTTQTPPTCLDLNSLPNLSRLECTFAEAANMIVPARPITHLKTCFSCSKIEEKRVEMTTLLSKVRLSTRPLRSLDIADSSYDEDFSMELLSAIVVPEVTTKNLRYLGTLVLPVAGRERLKFYGMLMRLPQIRCVEVDVSEWVPPPESPPAFRALASELRIYNPSVTRVVFVQDFERTVITAVNGACRIDDSVSTDILWRDI